MIRYTRPLSRPVSDQGRSVVDSREVAQMVEKQHEDLLRDIRGYVKIMENFNERNFAPVDFFIPST